MKPTFNRAVRRRAKLRLSIAAPSGAGKTLGALMIAKGMRHEMEACGENAGIAVIDSERGSSELYASEVRLADGTVWTPPPFDVCQLSEPFTPESYVGAIEAAEDAGYGIIIADSTTHEWSGAGGCLEIKDKLALTPKYKGNSWAAWSEVSPRHQRFLDKMAGSKCHLIATMRSKTETAQEERGGRKVVVKLGTKAEQREGSEFEFSTVLEIMHDGHLAYATKDRTGVFMGRDPERISELTGTRLIEWLNTGEAPPEPPKPITPEQIETWRAQILDTRTEEALDKVRSAAMEACAAVSDRAAAAKVNEITKPHRAWIRATAQTKGTNQERS